MKKYWWLVGLLGGGLVAGAVARGSWGWITAADPATPAAVVQVLLWLPWMPDRLQVGLLLAGLVLLLAAASLYGLTQRPRGRPTPPPRPRVSSAFAIDPWSDTEPVLQTDAPASPSEQVATLMRMARRLEARGRLRAAREIYRQAYEAAAADPSLTATAGELLVALRKVERRLAYQRASRWQRWWHWMRNWWALPE